MKETSSGPRLSKNLILGLALLALAASYLRVEAGAGTPGEPARPSVGLRVHPPVMLVRDVTPGVEVLTPAPITVENSGAWPVKCTISPFAPSTIGIRTMRGYADIPEPSWCMPATTTLALDPGESSSIPVSILVPEDRCYENRSWCVAFSVQTEGTGTLGASAYPYVYIETNTKQKPPRPLNAADGARALPKDSPRGTGINLIEERENRDAPSSGCLGISCGVLDAGDVAAGKTASAGSITVENRYGEDVQVEIKPLVPGSRGLARNVLLTPGHTWTEDEGWLHTRRQGRFLLAGKKTHFEIVVSSPISPSTYNYRWEGFLEIVGPHGPEGIVRVRWRTTSPSAIVRAPDGGG